jgi:hypothetical protein
MGKRASIMGSIAPPTRRFSNYPAHRAPRGDLGGRPPRLPQKIVGLEPMGHYTTARRQVAPRPKSRGF